MDEVFNILNKLEIKYEILNHEPVFTVKEAEKIKEKIDGVGCKNLFLKNKKSYYLLIAEYNANINLKELSKKLGGRLSFGSEEELKNILNLTKGSVSPFGLIYDKENLVNVIIQKNLNNKKLLFHPNINTKTISISYNDLIKFISFIGSSYIFYQKGIFI